MAKRRALSDTVKDPMVKKKHVLDHRRKQNSVSRTAALKIAFSLLLGFAGGLLAGRFIKL
jgi:hypothetical protein